jgi:hypothetical protein
MNTYTVYHRAEDGTLTRRPEGFVPTEPLTTSERIVRYQFEERLLGWPERVVYWRHETGQTYGVAL